MSIEPSGARARLWLDGYERSIVGSGCAEVAAASALIVAVALGANPARARSTSGASAEPRPPDTNDAPSRAAEPAPAPRRSPPTLAAAPVPGVSREPASLRPAAAELIQDGALASTDAAASRGRWGLDVGAHAELNTWLDVGPSKGVGAFVEVLAPARGWSARAGAVYASGEGNTGARRATLSYMGGFLDLCPLVWGAGAWRWVSCAELQLGLLQASGDGASALATPLSQQALAAGAAGVTRLLTPRLWAFRLELEAGAVVPLVRNTFLFEAPEQVVFETPELGFLARAGLRVPLDGGE